MREHKSERSIQMTVSLAFVSPVLAEGALEGRLPRGFSVKRLTDLPMLWSEQWRAVGLPRADSGSSRTWLIHASSTACRRYTDVDAVSVQPLPSSGLGNRILRAETGGRIQAQSAGERPEFGSQTGRGSLTSRNCEGFYRPGNRVGLPGLDGGRCRYRTCDPSRVKGVLYR
jgi:hypothetical protein